MIPRLHDSGRGVGGLADYTLHDKPSLIEEDGHVKYPTTSARVAWTESLGLPDIDPELMVRCMQGVVADAPILKQRAGVSGRGRKLTTPYGHISLNWGPDENPSKQEMVGTARQALSEIGITRRHYALLIAHTDTDHPHVHVVFCRVSPETGRAAKLSHSGRQLSTWAERWEREHGGIRIENRVTRRLAREHNQRARRKAYNEGREVNDDNLIPEPPMAPARGRSPRGESVQRTPEEKKDLTELYERHRTEKTPPAQRKAERFVLHVEHLETRLDAVDVPIETEPPPRVALPARPRGPEPSLAARDLPVEPPRVAVPVRPERPEPSLAARDLPVEPPRVAVPVRPERPEPSLAARDLPVEPPRVAVPVRPERPEPSLAARDLPVEPPRVAVPVRPERPERLEKPSPTDRFPPPSADPRHQQDEMLEENRRRREEREERRQAREAEARRQRQEHAEALRAEEARRRMLAGLEKGWGDSAETHETAETLVTEFPDLAGRWGHLSERQEHQVNTDEAGRYGHIEFVDDDKNYFWFGAARRELEQHVIGIAAEKAPEGRPTAAPGFKDLLPRALVRLQELVDGIIARALGREQPKPTAAPEASPPSSSREPAAGAAGVESRGPTPPQPASPPPDRATERQPRPLTEPAVVRRAGDPAGGRPLRPAAPGPPPRSKGRGGPG